MTAPNDSGNSSATDEWLASLCRRPGPAAVSDPVPPTGSQLRERLRLLAVPEADLADVVATLPDPARSPELWQALLHCHRALLSDLRIDWPDAPAELGAAGRYFYVHVCLMALPAALARQEQHGVPREVVRATFADLGAKLVSYRKAYGVGGFDKQSWIVRHFRGALHRLGRLQFERSALDADACGGHPASDGPVDGEAVLDVHIPGDGPLAPGLCEASFAAAPAFFTRHFPGTSYRFATCHSWLLDQQLADDLPADSNIVRFQQRFRLFGARPVGDRDVLEFVFHVPPGGTGPNRSPRDSTLRRVLRDRWDAGGHWHTGHGWTALPTTG